MAQKVKKTPAVPKTWVLSLGWEDPLKEGMATHSSILPWRIPMDRGARQATVHGVAKSQTRLEKLGNAQGALWASPQGLSGKESTYNTGDAGDMGSISG